MSNINSSADHLTLNADGVGKDIKFQANGVEKASISSAGAFTSTSIDATKLSGALPAIDGSALTSVNTPAFFAYNNADQSIAGSVSTKVTFNTEDYDSDNAFASNRFTVPTGEAGTYIFTAAVRTLDGSHGMYLSLRKNSGNSMRGGDMGLAETGFTADMQFTTSLVLAAGDYVEVYVYILAAIALQGVGDGWYRCHFSGFKLAGV